MKILTCLRLKYRKCAQAKYVRNAEGDFVIEDLPEMPELPWIVVDPLAPGKFYLFMLMLLKI